MVNKIISIAKEAGEVLRAGFHKNFEIEFKSNEANLVTEFDKKSEGIIIDFISKEFPTHSVLAEESGAFCNNEKINVSKNEKLSRGVLVTGFPYTVKEEPGNSFEFFTEFTKRSRAVRRLGSAALDLCYVASGVFDAFWEMDLQAWDMCAGTLLVKEAGGKVSDFRGNPVDIFNKEILASNGVIEKKMIEIIESC